MDSAYNLWDLAVSKPALRIANMVVFAASLAGIVIFHVLWYHKFIDTDAEVVGMGACLAVTVMTIVAEGLLQGYERRVQRGFRVILKDNRSDQ